MAKERQRPERDRPIQRRRQKGSKLPLVLILLAVAGGGIYALHRSGKVDVGKHAKQVASQSKRAIKQIEKKITPVGPTPGGKSSTDPGKSATPGKQPVGTPRRIDPQASERARAVLAEAKGHFDEGRFEQAREAIGGFLETSPAIGSQAREELEALARRAFQHHVLTSDYRLDARLEGETTELTLIDKSVLEVRITSKDDEEIHYVWKGIKSKVKKAAVLDSRVISRSELTARDLIKYQQLLAEASRGGPRAFLRVIKFCVERDMKSRVSEVTAQAETEQQEEAKKTKLKLLGFFEELFEAKAAILYQRYLTFSQRGLARQKQAVFDKIVSSYPETTIARELQTLRRKGEPPAAQEEKQVIARLERKLAPQETKTSNASARELLRQGDRQYALALKEYRLSFPGQPDADEHLRPAWNLFKKAQALYEKAYGLDSRPSIEDKIALCQREIYSCQKQMKIK